MDSTPPIPPIKSRAVIHVLSFLDRDFLVLRANRAVDTDKEKTQNDRSAITDKEMMKYSSGNICLHLFVLKAVIT